MWNNLCYTDVFVMLSTVFTVQLILQKTKLLRQFPVNWESKYLFHLAYGGVGTSLTHNFIAVILKKLNGGYISIL